MRQQKIGYFSSYDRGLEILLHIWLKIIEKYPKATLDICYGWDLFDTAYSDNPERMAWKEKMNKMMEQKGITHHGRVSKNELDKITEKCGIWAYPTNFDEINCITALNCQKLGCVPVVINRAALKETVGSGVKVDGDVYDSEVRKKYVKELLDIMGDESRWADESSKAIEFAKSYSWSLISDQWIKEFKR